jgi:hypothetical protein
MKKQLISGSRILNADKAGYLYIEKEIMDYMYYLMKYNKERELSNFEKAVNLI